MVYSLTTVGAGLPILIVYIETGERLWEQSNFLIDLSSIEYRVHVCVV
jgi:hypothetical protein